LTLRDYTDGKKIISTNPFKFVEVVYIVISLLLLASIGLYFFQRFLKKLASRKTNEV